MPQAKRRKKPAGTAPLIRRLQRLSTEVLSDVLDVMGLSNQVLSSTIQPLSPGMSLGGPAFCVRGHAIDAEHPAPGVTFEIDRRVAKGCVVVIATGGWTASAAIGGNVALAYKRRGCGGLIVAGAVRDPNEMRAMRLPTFATHTTPRRPAGRWSMVAFAEPVAIPGQSGEDVVVHPGDLIRGDDNGILVIPAALAEEVVSAAETLEALEKKVVRDIRRGVDREAALKRTNRYKHIRRVLPA